MSDSTWNTVGSSRGRGAGRGRPAAAAAEFPAEAAAAFGRKRGGGRGHDGAFGAPPQSGEMREMNTDFDSKASMAFSRPKRTSDERTSQVFSPAAAAAFGSVGSKQKQGEDADVSCFQKPRATGSEFGDTASSAFGKSTARSGFQDEMANIAFGKQRRTSDREGGFTTPRSTAMPSGIRNDLSSIVDSALGAAGTEVKSHWAGSALFKRKEPKKSAAAVAERVDASNTIMFPSLGGSSALVAPKPVKSFSAVLRDSIAGDEKSAEEKAATEAAEETKRLSEAYDRRNYKMLSKRPVPSKNRTLSSESSDGLECDEESESVAAYVLTRKHKALIAPDVSASDYSEHPDESQFHEEELAVAEEDM